MKIIFRISLAVLALTLTACGGSSGEPGDSAQDRAGGTYAELLEGVGAENVDDFSACVLPVLKDTSGLSWDDIATRLDNSSTFEDSEEQFADVPEPDDKGQATLLACFAELSEDDVQKIILGETVMLRTLRKFLEVLQRSQKAGQTTLEKMAFLTPTKVQLMRKSKF